MRKSDRTYTYENEDGEEITVNLPGAWEICGGCSGHGSSSAYLGAITSEERERDWHPDEWEGYMRGDLDRRCEECAGTGKVWAVDMEKVPAEARESMERRAQYDAEDAHTRRMEEGRWEE